MFNLRRIKQLSILQTDLFPLSVPHGFLTKRPAQVKPNESMPLPDFRIDSLPDTAKWWIQLRDALFTPNHVCFVNKQVHGGNVKVINPDNLPGEELSVEGFRLRILGEGDAIIKPFTRSKIFLTVTTADCIPCLVYDKETGAVGVVHAGWRSLSADIPGATVRAFIRNLGSKPANLCWALGPSIDAENYQVGPEVIASLETAGYADSDWKQSQEFRPGWVKERKGDKYRLDLAACLLMRLRNLGIPPEQIDVCSLSTFKNANLFYSYRRDGGIKGLQASVIG